MASLSSAGLIQYCINKKSIQPMIQQGLNRTISNKSTDKSANQSGIQPINHIINLILCYASRQHKTLTFTYTTLNSKIKSVGYKS